MTNLTKICTGLWVLCFGFVSQVAGSVADQQTVSANNSTEVIQALYITNMVLMRAADLVEDRNPDDALQDYADHVTRDHTWMNRLVKVVAKAKDIELDSDDMSEKMQHIETQMSLEVTSLALVPTDEFRIAFLDAAAQSHRKTLDFYVRVDQENTDRSVKFLIFMFRQLEEKHLADAQTLQEPLD